MDIDTVLVEEMARSNSHLVAARPTDIDPESDSWLDEVLLSQTGGLGSPDRLVPQDLSGVSEPDSQG